jgi:hypothetical protein
MVYASAGIEYYLFYIQIRRWWREVKMPSFAQSFAYAKYSPMETTASRLTVSAVGVAAAPNPSLAYEECRAVQVICRKKCHVIKPSFDDSSLPCIPSRN